MKKLKTIGMVLFILIFAVSFIGLLIYAAKTDYIKLQKDNWVCTKQTYSLITKSFNCTQYTRK